MLSRILLDPAATAGGSPSAPTPPAPAPAPAPPTHPAPVPPPVPPVPGEDLTRMLLGRLTAAEARNAEMEAAERARLADVARREQDLLAEKGNTEAAKQALQAARDAHDKEIAAERGQKAEIERRARTSFRDRELATALAGRQLIPGSAPQLIKLLRDELEAHPEGDGYTVRTKDFVAAADFVARELAKPEFAHFLAPTTAGGAPPNQANRGGSTPPPAAPETPEQRRAQQMRDAFHTSRGMAPGLAGTYGRPVVASNN